MKTVNKIPILALLILSVLVSVSCSGDKGASSSDDSAECTLTYSDGSDDLEIAVQGPEKYVKGSSVTLADGILREYYVFSGWTDGINTYRAGDTYTVNQNTVLSAVWELDTSVAVGIDELEFERNADGTVTLLGIAEGVVKHAPILVIPESDGNSSTVSAIAENAFESDLSLVRVVIPSTVKSIGTRAFSNCSSIEQIVLSEGVESIGEYAFYHNARVTSVVLPDSVRELGAHSFRNCNSLKKLTLGKGITSIGESAFRGCSRLESVTVGEYLSSVGDYAFDGCMSLRTVLFPGEESVWKSIDFGVGNEYFEKGATFMM